MLIQPQSLKYFAEVARTGSLRQASETFFVAPSAISKQISNLERELGAALFDRSPRGVVLTLAGQLLLD
jgi:DNA-binding transcriptional LysR family regulator